MKNNKNSKIFNDSIIYTKCLDNSVLVMADSLTTVRYLNKESLAVLNGFKLGTEQKWYKNSIISFCDNGDYFALISEDAKYSTLYNANTKKAISRIDRNKGGVSCVAVDRRGKYFFSCGEAGKTFVVDIKSAKLSFTLPGHIDTVNDIVFSPNNQNVATASYDKKILIFNYIMMTPVAKLIAHTAPVMKIHFIDDKTLFSVDKNGGAIIWDLVTKKVLLRLSGIHDDITQVTSCEKFLFLGSDLGFILVYDLEDFKQVSRSFIKLSSSITSLEFDSSNNTLILGSEDGELYINYIYDGDEHLESLIENEEYELVEKFIEENPLLRHTKAYVVFNTIWEKTILKASELLQSAQRDEAKEAMRVFHQTPSKRTIMKKMLQEYEEFDKFVLMIKNGNIALAYSIANKHKSYKKSKVYLALEDRWRKLFAQAQVLAQEPSGKDRVYKLLYQYRGISEKTIHIQEMLTKTNVFNRFKDSITKKDFKIAFELIKVNPFLREFKEYNSLMTYGDALYIHISKSIDSRDLHDSIKSLRVLIDFPDYEMIAKKMIQDIESQGKFHRAVEDEDFGTAYNLLSKSMILEDTINGQKLIKAWESDFSIAEVYASKGDISGIDSVMSNYRNISSKNMSLVAIYSWAYITQIENQIKQKRDKARIEKGIRNYILNFGHDDHISSTYEIFEKQYGKSKLNLDSLKKGSRDMWRVSMRVANILE